jgi:hypothetical protein
VTLRDGEKRSRSCVGSSGTTLEPRAPSAPETNGAEPNVPAEVAPVRSGSDRPVWYAGRDTRAGELWTMLHLPYTLMVLSFVAVGTALAAHPAITTFVWSEAAYFLGLGIGAHLLDQVSGMGTRYVRHWSDRELWTGGIGALAGAAAIGIVGGLLYFPPGFLALVALQAFFAASYPLAPLFRGWFHRDAVFALAWGALPFLTALYAQGGSLGVETALIAATFAALAWIEISLSRVSRTLRAALGSSPADEPNRPLLEALRRRVETGLRALAAGTYLLALALLAGRFLPGLFGRF